MKPSEKLIEIVNRELEPHGLELVGEVEWPEGAHRSSDSCRWAGTARCVGKRAGTWSVASWDTITRCVNRGVTVRFRRDHPRQEADIMVDAK